MKFKMLGLVLGVLAMTGCATTGFRAGAPDGAIDVIAHRGASAYAPENTLASFKLARELNADWFELDCTLTKDGQVIVIHDDDTERTASVPGKVAKMTLAELKALDAGSWKAPEFAGERMPTLAEALDLARNLQIGVYIEIKDSANDYALMRGILEATQDAKTLSARQRGQVAGMIRDSRSLNYQLTLDVIKLIRERRMKRQVVIQSFSPIVCAVSLHEAPEIRTEFLAAKDEKKPEQWPYVLRWDQLLGAAGFNLDIDTVDRDTVPRLHSEKKTIAVWTVDDEETMRRLADWGVDAIITNKPDLCLRVLGR
ncbi:MAG: glycerophosphodiester phosphodiesterase family protein [Candidatus Hydrogenedentes bacterium]|nr:glycerophosphodiester phosphodiesterase family protein [Candidatus Hydrogenedentota bacterium]